MAYFIRVKLNIDISISGMYKVGLGLFRPIQAERCGKYASASLGAARYNGGYRAVFMFTIGSAALSADGPL